MDISRYKQAKSHLKKTSIWLRKGHLERETKSLLIAAQNNIIRNNYVKAKIDKMPKYNIYRLCVDKDKTINHVINECSRLMQKKYKTRHDWVGKVSCARSLSLTIRTKSICTTQKLSKKMRRSKFFNILSFEVQTDYLISARRSDLVILNNNNNNNKKEPSELRTLPFRLTTA